MKTITTFTENKEAFTIGLRDGFFTIVRNKDGSLELICHDDDLHETTKVEELLIGNPAYSTYRLRQYCDEFHPEIDFDKEFGTNNPGVYARYQKKIYSELEEALKVKGYKLLLK